MNPRHKPFKSSPFLLSGLLFLGAVSYAPAQSDITSTWNGGSADWSTAGDWSNSPNPHHSSTINHLVPNNGNGGYDFDAVIDSGDPTVSANITVDDLTLSDATITVDSRDTLSALNGFDWTSGTLKGGGTVSFDGATLDGTSTANSINLVSSGTTTVNAATINFENGSTWINNGTIDLTGDASLVDPGERQSTLTNNGTFKITGNSGSGTISIAFTNASSGVIQNDTSDLVLDFTGDVDNSGTISVGRGAEVDFDGGLHLHDGSAITSPVSGHLDEDVSSHGSSGGIVEIGDGVTADGTTTLDNDITLLFDGGDWSGTSELNGGTLEWTGGTFDGYHSRDNTTTLDSNTAFVIDTNGSEEINAQNLITDGMTTINGTSSISFSNGATWTNNGTIDLADDASLDDPGERQSSLTNNGTFEKTGGSGTSDVSIAFDNTGSLKVEKGTLDFEDGLTSSGWVNIDRRATMDVTGSFTQTGPGGVDVEGTLNGNVSVGSGGSIGGGGTVNGQITVASDGSTTPGDPKIFTATGIEYQDGSTAQFFIDTATDSSHPPTPGVNYDQIVLTGNVPGDLQIDSGTTTLQLKFTGASLAAVQANVENNLVDNYFLFGLGGSGGTSTGEFSDLTLIQGTNTYTEAITDGDATFASLGLQFDVSYTGDSSTDSLLGGDDVGFGVFAVPEPADWAPLIALLALIALLQRRRTQA